MKGIKTFLQRPKNSFYLGLLIGLLSLISLIFPIFQMLALTFLVDIWREFVLCGYCLLTDLNIFYIALFCVWTIYCAYKIKTFSIYRPLQISLFMLVGYILTNNFIALSFEMTAMRSNDAFKYLFLWTTTGTISSLTPIIYGLIFHLISNHQNKKQIK